MDTWTPTPGPWSVHTWVFGFVVTANHPDGAGHVTIVTGQYENLGRRYRHQTEANARLIAAAPELAALADRLVGPCEYVDAHCAMLYPHDRAIRCRPCEARALLARRRGVG